MSFAGIFTAAALAATLNASGLDQAPPGPTPQEQATQLEDVVVTGERNRVIADRFVDTIGAPPRDRRLARWHGRVCIAVANLPAEAAQYMIDRISAVALELGVEPGEPGCTANVVIVATTDSAGLATALVDEHHRAFRPGGSGMNLSMAALEDFKTSDRPIRWWHISVPVDSDTGARAVRLPGESAPTTSGSRASRLRSNIRDDLNKVIIIIDVDRLGDTTFEGLTEYVSLVALAQVDSRADTTELPTVLNLFADGTPGLTAWDHAYLQALYHAEPNRASATAQAGDLAGLMVRERREQESSEAPTAAAGSLLRRPDRQALGLP